MTTKKDDAMWRLIEQAMNPCPTELPSVERELHESSCKPLETSEIDRIDNRAQVIVTSDDCTRQQPRTSQPSPMQLVGALSLALFLTISVAWVGNDNVFPKAAHPALSAKLEGSLGSASSATSTDENWGLGLQFLAGMNAGAVDILIELRAEATPIGWAAHAALKRYASGIEPEQNGTSETIQAMVGVLQDETAEIAERVAIIHKIEWFLATTDAATRQADSSTKNRRDKKEGFVELLDRKKLDASESIGASRSTDASGSDASSALTTPEGEGNQDIGAAPQERRQASDVK